MSSYLVRFRRTNEDSSSMSPSAHEGVSRIVEGVSGRWTIGSILRDDVPIDEETLRSDAAGELAAFQIESTDHRMLTISHRDGHEWFFLFPEGWSASKTPQYAPTTWANEHPEDASMTKGAAAVAVEEAKNLGW